MATQETLKAIGLNLSPNQLDLPAGSLSEAKNVVIRRDNVIEPRRGYSLFGTALGGASDRCTTLFEYKDKIFRHYLSTLDVASYVGYDGVQTFRTIDTNINEAEADLRLKKVESNGNLYLATDEGIKKLSAKTGDDLDTVTLTNAGSVKAVDFTTVIDGTSGFLPPDSTVAYRVVWGQKDLNNNLILGAPSQRQELYFPLGPINNKYFNDLLTALDQVSSHITPSIISDGNYYSTLNVSSSENALGLYNNLKLLTTKMDNDLLLADKNALISNIKLQISKVEVTASGIAEVTFATDPTGFFLPQTKIEVLGVGDSIARKQKTKVSVNTSGAFAPLPLAPTGGQPGTFFELNSANNTQSFYVWFYNSSAPASTDPALITSNNLTGKVGVKVNLGAVTIGTPTNTTIAGLIKTACDADAQFSTMFTTTVVGTDVTFETKNYGVADEFLLTNTNFDITTLVTGLDTVTTFENSTYTVVSMPTPVATNKKILLNVPTTLPIAEYDISGTPQIKSNEFRGISQPPEPSDLELNSDLENLQVWIDSIITILNLAPENWSRTLPTPSSRDYFNNIVVQSGSNVKLRITIPSEVNSNYFVQVYRSAIVTANGTVSINDLTASDELQLVYEAYPTSTEISQSWMEIIDSTEDAFRGANLYTNQSTGEGILQANERPPFAKDVARYKNSVFFANTRTRNRLTISLLGVPKILEDITNSLNPSISIVSVNGVSTYSFVNGPENAALKQVSVSTSPSAAIAIEETAKSLIRVINQNTSEQLYAYYISAADGVPGKIFLESKLLDKEPFYVLGNTVNMSSVFNPDISYDFAIQSVTTGLEPTVTTSPNHGLTNGDEVVISFTQTVPAINGVFKIFSATANSFKITVPSTILTGSGVGGFAISTKNGVYSDNEEKKNRVYFSKTQQPESVPLVNYLDVGNGDNEIVRIYPLRDSLFVFKAEALYRISGESAPFSLQLFDSSTQLAAPDTLDVNNNLLYGLTTQGVMAVSESGVNIISRAIDTEILKLPIYPNYKKASFGVGYESDNSYTLWTLKSAKDEYPTIGYRYSNLTQSWTTYEKNVSCGFVNQVVDDKAYYGSADTNFIEQERKSFSRLDYSEHNFDVVLGNNALFSNILQLSGVSDISVGDVLVQTQDVSIYEFNMLLKKLDIDTQVADTDFHSTLKMVAGDNFRTKILALAAKLDLNPGSLGNYVSKIDEYNGTINDVQVGSITTITTSSPHNLLTGRKVRLNGFNTFPSSNGEFVVTVVSPTVFTIDWTTKVLNSLTGSEIFETINGSFGDIKGCFNIIIDNLNLDNSVGFANYHGVTNQTTMECIVTAVDNVQKKVTVNVPLELVVGNITVYKSNDIQIVYSPITFGDLVNIKHLREATVMFISKAFTSAELSFATDLLPEYKGIPFNAEGNGVFGHTSNFGSGFFGGASHSAPFRTYIPRQCQRCRFIVTKFNHKVAREHFGIYGITITGENLQTTRGYRT